MKKFAFTETFPNSRIHYTSIPSKVSFEVIFDSNVTIDPQDIECSFDEVSGKLVINICGLTK